MRLPASYFSIQNKKVEKGSEQIVVTPGVYLNCKIYYLYQKREKIIIFRRINDYRFD